MKRYVRSAKTNFSRNANRRFVSSPEPEDSGVSEEAYNALMEFGNSLKGTRISGVIEGNTNSYEIGATIEDYRLSEHYFDLIFSSTTCFSDPELTVGFIWTPFSEPVNFSTMLDYSTREKYEIPSIDYYNHATWKYSSDIEIQNIITTISNWLDNIEFDFDGIYVVTPATADAMNYLSREVQINLVSQLMINSTTDPLIRRYGEDHGKLPLAEYAYVDMEGVECDALRVYSADSPRVFEPVVLEYPGGVTIEDLKAAPNNINLSFRAGGVEYLRKSVMDELVYEAENRWEDIPFTIPIGDWYVEDFGYNYKVLVGGRNSISIRLSGRIDPEYPFKSDIEVAAVKISEEQLEELVLSQVEARELANSADMVQTLYDIAQNIINENYNDARFRKNLRAAFRRRAKSEGVIFGEE